MKRLRTISALLLCLLCLTAAPLHASVQQPCQTVEIEATRLPDMTVPRGEHSTFYINGELTVVGGHTTSFVPTATAEYLHDGQWHQLPLAYAHDNGTAVELSSGQVLITGGQDQPLGIGQTFTVELYDPATHTSTGFGCLSTKRTMACGVELDSGRVLITGNWYHEDGIEMFEGQSQFVAVKDVTIGRVSPFVFRIAKDNAIIVGNHDERFGQPDSIVCDRLHGDPFYPPLLQEWRPMTGTCVRRNETAFIGDETKGIYAYLMPVVREGQLAIALVQDTVFTLLPTSSPVPTHTASGDSICYPQGIITCDRARRKAYIVGADKDKRLYVYAIDYAPLFTSGDRLKAILPPPNAQLPALLHCSPARLRLCTTSAR